MAHYIFAFPALLCRWRGRRKLFLRKTQKRIFHKDHLSERVVWPLLQCKSGRVNLYFCQHGQHVVMKTGALDRGCFYKYTSNEGHWKVVFQRRHTLTIQSDDIVYLLLFPQVDVTCGLLVILNLQSPYGLSQ